MKDKKTVHRTEYPPIYEKINKGRTYYVVKAKRAGYIGKSEEWFKTLKEAKARASELAEDVSKHGIQQAALNDNDRYWLVRGKEMLKPYNVSWHDCFTREVEYQKALLAKLSVGTVTDLVKEWLEEIVSGKYKTRDDRTIDELRDRGQDLVDQFGGLKIIEVKRDMIDGYIATLTVGKQTKKNRLNKFNQFFRWVKIQKKQITDNPCEGIKFEPEKGKKVVSLVPHDMVRKLIKTAFEHDKGMFHFFLLGFFAGLRPEEASQMLYENINGHGHNDIHVEAWMSKTRQERSIEILPTLKAWFDAYPLPKSGPVIPKGYTNRFNRIRIMCGYKLSKGKWRQGDHIGQHKGYHNPDGIEWKEDCVRHTFASSQLVVTQDRPALAEYMGNSVGVIRDYYRRMIPKPQGEAFFNILPTTIDIQIEADSKISS